MYCVENFYSRHKEALKLELLAGDRGLRRAIKIPEAHRPGLSLSGYLKSHAKKRILVFGKVEIEYLRDLEISLSITRLENILTSSTPAVIVARGYRPPKELLSLCKSRQIPLFCSTMKTMDLLSKLTVRLTEDFSQEMHCHGTLVEVFGVGVLIQGESGVGKSEAALGLIERGHRLISDDVVRVCKKESTYLEGSGAELTRHHMEIRGIGIINVANLYGAVCVRDRKSIDVVVRLEPWDDQVFYDRLGLEEAYLELLGIKVPFQVVPVKPGRDVVLLVETIALNQRLKAMGYNSAKEFKSKLTQMIERKDKRKRASIS